jgi:uncharacterized membrane protein
MTPIAEHDTGQAPAFRMAALLIGMGITHFSVPKPFDTVVPV